MNGAKTEAVLSSRDARIRDLAEQLRTLVQQVIPDAVEEPDPAAKLIAYTVRPGTYKGLIVAIALHASHVNLTFSKGVELLDVDTAGRLEGTGKKARHIAFRDDSRLAMPEVRDLIAEASRRTPRA